MSKLIDITGQDFGYWHVLYKAPTEKGKKTKWHCVCTACGKEKDVDSGHLRSGTSTNCGCVRMQKMKAACIKDETGKDYGYLHVVRMATEEEKPRHDRYGIYWNCTCTNCGRENVIVFGDYLRNGDTSSCGCITSKNESAISKLLDNAGIKYKTQYTFDDLTSPDTNINRDKLMFDFAIFNNDELIYLIEFDGVQHFSHANCGWNNLAGLQKTHRNDLIKNQYCFEHNIPLIRIPYNFDYVLKDLKLDSTRCLLTKNNEKEYYKNYEG